MNTEPMKRHILGFMYSERMKWALLTASLMLDSLEDMNERERPIGLNILAPFVRAVRSEMTLIANVMEDRMWQTLGEKMDLMEGHIRLGQMDAARQELSRTISKVTTQSGQAMTSLEKAGLL